MREKDDEDLDRVVRGIREGWGRNGKRRRGSQSGRMGRVDRVASLEYGENTKKRKYLTHINDEDDEGGAEQSRSGEGGADGDSKGELDEEERWLQRVERENLRGLNPFGRGRTNRDIGGATSVNELYGRHDDDDEFDDDGAGDDDGQAADDEDDGEDEQQREERLEAAQVRSPMRCPCVCETRPGPSSGQQFCFHHLLSLHRDAPPPCPPPATVRAFAHLCRSSLHRRCTTPSGAASRQHSLAPADRAF